MTNAEMDEIPSPMPALMRTLNLGKEKTEKVCAEIGWRKGAPFVPAFLA